MPMFARLACTICLTLCATGCNESPSTPPPEKPDRAAPADTLLTITTRGGGIGYFPYRALIYGDGTVVYEDDIGETSYGIPRGHIGGLIASFESAGFFAMKDRYEPPEPTANPETGEIDPEIDLHAVTATLSRWLNGRWK